ncbi:type II toxin-antitoxin system PemK/MazF family toxin [Limosilactobacillus fermentum]
MEPMDIYIADVPFDDGRGSKIRPALVIEFGRDRVVVLKVTSQYQRKSAQIKRLYYPIREWQEAGLKKQSYVDTHKFYRLSKKWVFNHRPIGKLTATDRFGLFAFMRQNKKRF